MNVSRRGSTPGQRGKITASGSASRKNYVATKTPKMHSSLFGSRDLLHRIDLCNQSTIPTQSKDFEVQSDIVYSKYLRSLAMKQLATKQMTRLNDSMFNQLLVQGEILQKQLVMQDKLENELEVLAVKKETLMLKGDLQALTEQCSSIVCDNHVSEKMAKLNSCLEQACNKLYLNNVKMFTNQEEFDKFVNIFETCSNKIKQLNMLHGSPQDIQKLADGLKEYLRLKEDLNNELVLTEQLEKKSDLLLLKTVSEMFAKSNGYL